MFFNNIIRKRFLYEGGEGDNDNNQDNNMNLPDDDNANDNNQDANNNANNDNDTNDTDNNANDNNEDDTNDADYSDNDTDNANDSDDNNSDNNNDYSSSSGSDNDSSSYDSGSSGNDENEDEIKKKEEELFATLSPWQIDMKNEELKNNFLTLYDSTERILDRVNDIKKSKESIEIAEYISNTLSDLRDNIHAYITKVYNKRSYTESAIVYNRYLVVLQRISSLLDVLVEQEARKQEEEENNDNEYNYDEDDDEFEEYGF